MHGLPGRWRGPGASFAPVMRAVLLLLTVLLPVLAFATDVQGTLSGDVVWKRSASPYVLTGDVTVGWGSRLTIEAGVQIIAAPEDALHTGEDAQRVELIVDGTLLVRGTAERPVVFTAEGGEGAWYGIRVRGGRGTVIDGALINGAQQGISLGMSAVVKNTSVSAVARDCLHVGWGKPSLENNDLRGCGAGAPGPRLPAEPRGVPPVVKEPSPAVSEAPPVRDRVPSPPIRLPPPSPPSTASSAPASRPPESPRPTATPPASGTTTPGRTTASRPTSPSVTPSPPSESPRVKPQLGGDKPEQCSPIPQVNESPACPGFRRWKKEQERLGAVPPGATLPQPPATEHTASPGVHLEPIASGEPLGVSTN